MLRARLIGAVVGAAGVLLLAFTGSGQEKLGLAGGETRSGGRYSAHRETQKELKLTKEQIAKITRIVEEAKTSKKKVEEAHGKVKGRGKEKAKGDDPVAKEQERLVREAMGGDFAELERETDQQINAILDSRQRTRLTQIVLRVQGPSAFLTPELIDALALGPEQLQMIQEILTSVTAEQEQYKESQKQAGELVKASGAFDLEKVRKNQQKTQARSFAFKLNKEVMPQIGKVLTRRQREIYNRMLGDSFDLAKLTGPEGQPLIDDSAGLAGLLLREPAVQLELKLTDPQKDQLSRGGRPDKVLDARQRNRLQQIVFQAEGLSALEPARGHPGSPARRRATRANPGGPVQSCRRKQATAGRAQSETLRISKPEDPEQEAARKEQEKARMRSGSSELNARVLGQVKAILTRRQRDIFARMQGEPFDFSKLRARPPVR